MDEAQSNAWMHRRSIWSRAPLVLLVSLCMGSDCFPQGSSSSDGGGYVGPGAPSIEVTVDGTHVGPAPASAGAYADLTTTRNEFGQLGSTDLVIHAEGQTQYGPARCDIHLSRFGMSIQPFRAAAYTIATPLGSSTPEGSASPIGPITVGAGSLSLQCSGAECGVLVVTIMDGAHIEGYLSGTLSDPSDGQASSVVCTFYVPWRTYQP